jgi:hypothetical protein
MASGRTTAFSYGRDSGIRERVIWNNTKYSWKALRVWTYGLGTSLLMADPRKSMIASATSRRDLLTFFRLWSRANAIKTLISNNVSRPPLFIKVTRTRTTTKSISYSPAALVDNQNDYAFLPIAKRIRDLVALLSLPPRLLHLDPRLWNLRLPSPEDRLE